MNKIASLKPGDDGVLIEALNAPFVDKVLKKYVSILSNMAYGVKKLHKSDVFGQTYGFAS